jgi:hypothetical protein
VYWSQLINGDVSVLSACSTSRVAAGTAFRPEARVQDPLTHYCATGTPDLTGRRLRRLELLRRSRMSGV